MNACGTTNHMERETGTDTLLRLLARPVGEEHIEIILQQLTDEDWETMLVHAALHGVELVLYDSLRVADTKGLVPARVLERLRETYLSAAARNTVMLHHAAGILSALKAEGIDVIVLKGLYLVESIFATIGLRTFSDLDLMVRRERLADALVVMQGLRYALSTWYDPKVQYSDIKHIPPLE